MEIILNILRNVITTLFLALVTITSWASDQNWPTQPITIVVGYTPGGASDQQARIVAQALEEQLKISVVVKNAPGGNNTIALRELLKGDPEYTFMLADSGVITGPASINQYDYQNIQPIMIWSTAPNVVFRNPMVDPKEFMQLAKSNQPIQIATPILSLPASKWIGSIKPLNAELIPFNGSENVSTVALGHVKYGVTSMATAWNWVSQKTVVPIMVSSDHRLSALPDVPTFRELGMSGEADRNWWGLVASKQVTQKITLRLHHELVNIISNNQKIKEFNNRGIDVKMRTQKESLNIFENTIKKSN